MPKEQVSPMLDRRLITGERLMLAHVYLKKGCIVPKHSHHNEQITYILEGELKFWIGEDEGQGFALKEMLIDEHDSPFDCAAHEEVRAKVEHELAEVPEPYRTAVVLRDIEGLSYEEIAEILQVSLGTVKSRLMRGRFALKKRLEDYARQAGRGRDLGLKIACHGAEAASLEVGSD